MIDDRRSGLISPRVLEDGRTFVTALLVGVKKARATPPSPGALEQAIEGIHRAAQTLFASTGGFSLQFLPDSLALNGVELPFENLAGTAVIREVLEARGVSSLGMKSEPNLAAVRKLVMLFQAGPAQSREVSSPRGEPRPVYGEGSGPQVVTAPAARRRDAAPARPDVDRRLLAVETYAKLLLAVREQIARVASERVAGTRDRSAPRVRAMRVIDDVIDLARDSAPELLRLAALPADVPSAEVHGANSAILAVLLGYALGVGRRELLDLGVAALLHAIAVPTMASTIRPEDVYAAAARFADDGESSRALELRFTIVAEQAPGRQPRTKPHLLSRILAVAAAYDRLVNGFAIPNGERIHPLDALARLAADKAGRFDPRIADLFQMILRAYPAGTFCVLESGEPVKVVDYGPRWDRPKVESTAHAGRTVDLMHEENGKLVEGISGTALFHGVDVTRPAPPRAVTGSGPAMRAIPGHVDGTSPQAPGEVERSGGLTAIPRTSSNARLQDHRPLKARETISAREAVARVRLPWVEQRAKAMREASGEHAVPPELGAETGDVAPAAPAPPPRSSAVPPPLPKKRE